MAKKIQIIAEHIERTTTPKIYEFDSNGYYFIVADKAEDYGDGKIKAIVGKDFLIIEKFDVLSREETTVSEMDLKLEQANINIDLLVGRLVDEEKNRHSGICMIMKQGIDCVGNGDCVSCREKYWDDYKEEMKRNYRVE